MEERIISGSVISIDPIDNSDIESTPSWVSDQNQVGNKVWRMVPGDGVNITKQTSSSIDTYTWNAKISPEEGNILKTKEDGLYVPEFTSKSAELVAEVEKLKSDIRKLRELEYRPTSSIQLNKVEDRITGNVTVIADAKISIEEGNVLELKNDGLYSKATDYGPGSISDIERRLRLLEVELYHLSEEIDYLKTTALITSDGQITPPVVVPGADLS